MRRRPLALMLVVVAAGLSGCWRTQPVTVGPPLPDLPVYEIASGGDTLAIVPLPPLQRASRDPFAGASNRRVTLTTQNADLRTLVLWLAQQAEVSLVLSQDVNARVNVAFHDVRAVDALRALMADAGLSVLVGDAQAPWPPVVFYQLAVNINTASAEAIAARFGVSLEMGKFIVESRPRP
ncbi:MAG: hypothetical protein WD801_13450 [Gemmatimonadaceae bacterium]